jgi:hypothetical protein
MSEEEKSETLHTPVVLRFGFLYNYKITLVVMWSIWLPLHGSNFLAQIPSTVFHIIGDIFFTLVILLGTWTVRRVVSGYRSLFGIFDDADLNQLSVHASISFDINQPVNRSKSMFKDDESYRRFQNRIRNLLFGKHEVILLTLLASILAIYVLITFLGPDPWSYDGVLLYPWTHIHEIVSQGILFPIVTFFAVAGLFFIFGYMRIIFLLGSSVEDLSVWNHTRLLRGDSIDIGNVSSYHRFYNDSTVIGQYTYQVTFQTVLTLVAGLFWFVNFTRASSSTFSLESWIMSMIVLPLAFLLFVLPQLRLHQVLSLVKDEELVCLENELDSLKLRFLVQLKDNSRSISTEERRCLCSEIDTITEIIQSTRNAPTWSFRMPAALKLVATASIPLVSTALQQVVIPFLFP